MIRVEQQKAKGTISRKTLIYLKIFYRRKGNSDEDSQDIFGIEIKCKKL